MPVFLGRTGKVYRFSAILNLKIPLFEKLTYVDQLSDHIRMIRAKTKESPVRVICSMILKLSHRNLSSHLPNKWLTSVYFLSRIKQFHCFICSAFSIKCETFSREFPSKQFGMD